MVWSSVSYNVDESSAINVSTNIFVFHGMSCYSSILTKAFDDDVWLSFIYYTRCVVWQVKVFSITRLHDRNH